MDSSIPMTRQYVIDHQLVDRYLMGKLTEQEAEAFEDFYVTSPETLDELEHAAPLLEGFRAMGAAGDLRGSNVTALKPKPSPVMRIVGSPAYGIAASLFAMFAVILLVLQPNAGQPRTEHLQASANVSIVQLAATRGGESGIEVFLGGSDQVVIELDLGYSAAERYSTTLRNAEGDIVWQAQNVTPDDSYLTLSLGKGLIPDGRYELYAEPADSDGESLSYIFTTRTSAHD